MFTNAKSALFALILAASHGNALVPASTVATTSTPGAGPSASLIPLPSPMPMARAPLPFTVAYYDASNTTRALSALANPMSQSMLVTHLRSAGGVTVDDWYELPTPEAVYKAMNVTCKLHGQVFDLLMHVRAE